MNRPQDLLAQPLTLPCGQVLKNRLAKSAMSEALGTTDNHATEGLATLYRCWAEGGTGLLVTGNVMIDRRALGEPNNVVLEDASDLPLLKAWAQAGKSGGAQIWVQLNHPGRQSPKGLNAETAASLFRSAAGAAGCGSRCADPAFCAFCRTGQTGRLQRCADSWRTWLSGQSVPFAIDQSAH